MSDPTRDGALALLHAVLVEHRTLDVALDGLLRREPPAKVRLILLLGAAAMLFLEAPAHAAVGTAVDLTKRAGVRAFGGLVNAVLRKVAAGGDLLAGLDMPRLDTPAWAWASWGAQARAIAVAHQSEASLDVSVKPGVAMDGVRLPTGSMRLPAGTNVVDLAGFAAGDFWVQDAAAALPAALLRPAAGELVLDLCAAPGGKTAQLASAGARVTAVERDPARLGTMRGNLARLGLAVELVLADASVWRPDGLFPAILLDAPCSATGTIRRHPDLLHLRKPRDIVDLTRIQDRLLDAAAAMLAPGGRLIYAVCSLQPEEGVQRVDAACARLGLRRVALSLAAIPESVTPQGDVRTHPAMWAERGGMDGFFIARLEKS